MFSTEPFQPHNELISAPSVWYRDDLMRTDNWRLQVAPEQSEQLHQVLSATDSLPIEQLADRQDLLPAWRDTFARLRYELDQGRGVVLMRGLDAERYSLQQLKRLYWLLSTCVGTPMVQNAVGDLLGEVIDRGHDYQANNVRGYTTSAALGFHCDPADVVALLCVHPARAGGTSHIVSAAALHNEMLQHNPEYLAPLYRGYHFDLRGEGAKGDPNEVTEHRVPVFHFEANQLSMRFNYRTIVDGMRKAGKPLQGDDLAAINCVAELCKRPDMIVDMDFDRGDIQWLSNYDCLHARSGFTDWPEPARHRRLLRVWLNLRHGRPLRDDFTNRFNNGPKQGPKVVPGAGYWAKSSDDG